MLGLSLVQPLDDDWRDVLDGVARSRGYPTSRDVAGLAARVAQVSLAYNDASRARATASDAGAARLGFWFARDVPKGAGAVRELVATGALPRTGVVRVLDVGAGLGATTWGVARALEASGADVDVEATWVDSDSAALGLAMDVARIRAEKPGIRVRASPIARPLADLGSLGTFDLVLAGQLLSELDVEHPPEERATRHAALIATWLDRCVAPNGSLVVVEPGLRDRSRHLHRIRDALAGRPGVTVFAPCLHQAACPALAQEGDWCHEDLAVDLPPWLRPVARAAGLRYEGLTFSYLVLRKDGARIGDALGPDPLAARVRVVSDVIRTKGKREAFVCGELGSGAALAPGRARAMRLDRHRGAANEAWERIVRGDLLAISPAPDLERARIDAGTNVVICGSAEGESR